MKLPNWGNGNQESGKLTHKGSYDAAALFNALYDVLVAFLITRGFPRPDAEATVSKILSSILDNGRTFPTLEDGENYLYAAVHNAIKNGPPKRDQPLTDNMLPGSELSPEEVKISMDTYQEIMDEIYKEPPQRAKIVLMHLDGLSTDEIATQLNISPQTVRNTQNKGITRIRERLVKRGIVPLKRLIDLLNKKKNKKTKEGDG